MRDINKPYVVPAPTGASIRDRLKGLTARDKTVLRDVGLFLGSLASRDLKSRCVAGLADDSEQWAARKRKLTSESSSRWAGAITKASNAQWALTQRGQAAHIRSLKAGITNIQHRLSKPVGAKGTKHVPGGYRNRREWFAKSRRLISLEARLAAVMADQRAGRMRVCRGGKRLANTRHNLVQAELTVQQWRERWHAARMFLHANGESGVPFGNLTLRITNEGKVSLRLPAALAHLANAPRGRYVLSCQVRFTHRGTEWRDRIATNRAVAYTISHDPARDRWYVAASWQRKSTPVVSLDEAPSSGCIGVDINHDHLAAWQLDVHGNPIGAPKRFGYTLSGHTGHRDAQVRHALTRLLRWAKQRGVNAIAVEDLDFALEKTREKYGRRKRFRQIIAGFPTARLRDRLTAMAAEADIAVVAVDPAYTSKWGSQHWRRPLITPHRRPTRHDAASIVIGRRAQGYAARRRMPPPRHDQSDRVGHRSIQAEQHVLGCEGVRPRAPGPRKRCASPSTERTRTTSPSNTVRDGCRMHETIRAP